MFLRNWVHSGCKEVERTRLIVNSDYAPVVIPATEVVTSGQVIGVRRLRRRSLKALRARKGR